LLYDILLQPLLQRNGCGRWHQVTLYNKRVSAFTRRPNATMNCHQQYRIYSSGSVKREVAGDASFPHLLQAVDADFIHS